MYTIGLSVIRRTDILIVFHLSHLTMFWDIFIGPFHSVKTHHVLMGCHLFTFFGVHLIQTEGVRDFWLHVQNQEQFQGMRQEFGSASAVSSIKESSGSQNQRVHIVLKASKSAVAKGYVPQWVRRVQKRNFGSWISLDFVVLVNSLGFK